MLGRSVLHMFDATFVFLCDTNQVYTKRVRVQSSYIYNTLCTIRTYLFDVWCGHLHTCIPVSVLVSHYTDHIWLPFVQRLLLLWARESNLVINHSCIVTRLTRRLCSARQVIFNLAAYHLGILDRDREKLSIAPQLLL